MTKKRVDIELKVTTLAWAASESTKLGISRRQYLARVIERFYAEGLYGNPSLAQAAYPLTYDEAYTKNNG